MELRESEDAESRVLRVRLRTDSEREGHASTVAGRLRNAADWIMDLDAQFRQLVQTGRTPQLDVPLVTTPRLARVQSETLANYRKLRLGVGELVRPLLLDPPQLRNLFPFQRQGVEWLIERRGAVLADDMGLGKTVQVISAMRLLFNRAVVRNALVICPKSLIANWERELVRWAPELGVSIIGPPSQIREEAWKALTGRCHVLITNYEQLRRPPSVLRMSTPELIVADEAHRLRNMSAQATAGTAQLKPKRFWALTGTPLERDLEDLATLLSLVAPNRFVSSDAKQHPASLRSRARPYLLRRRKQDVLEDLPPVLDSVEMVELSEAQERAYRTAIRQYRGTQEKGTELALLTRLQSLCDMDSKSRQSSKVDRVISLLERIHDQGEKAVVFSYRLEPLRELWRRIADRWGKAAGKLLVGEMDHDERERAVASFRSDDAVLALLASTRLGGEGLTLVEANHVFLFNQWWNPSANDQARDRVVRIGQRRNVRIYRFCCRGTIEESLEQILDSKRVLFHDAVEKLSQSESTMWTNVLREISIDRLLQRDNLQAV